MEVGVEAVRPGELGVVGRERVEDGGEEASHDGEGKQEGEEHGEDGEIEIGVVQQEGESQRHGQHQREAPDPLGEGSTSELCRQLVHQQERQQAAAEEIDGAPQRGNLRFNAP